LNESAIQPAPNAWAAATTISNTSKTPGERAAQALDLAK
jgi:hypothetical protein